MLSEDTRAATRIVRGLDAARDRRYGRIDLVQSFSTPRRSASSRSDSVNPTIAYTVAIVSGFSERFIVGAIEAIATSKDESREGKEKEKKKDSIKDDGIEDNKLEAEAE